MSLIPFSNPGGNNQTSPMSGALKPTPIAVGDIPGSPTATRNPYTLPTQPIPMGAATPATAAATTGGPAPYTPTGIVPMGTSASQGFITNASSYSSGENDLQKQLIDIYGKGVGGSLFALLNSMSGTDSTILQEYIASLQPEMAKASAGLSAGLGAAGVGANSSVNAIAQANLAAQEQASIAGESAKLTQGQEELTAQILMGMSGAAQKEVATSAWSTFADVISNITGDIGNLAGGDYSSLKPQSQAQTTPVPTSGSTDYSIGDW